MTTTAASTAERRRLQFLEDYCPSCNELGHHQPDRRIRMASLTEPVAVTWPGDRRLICYYACEDCGHSWTRADLWTAENAGFDPKRRRGAA